MNICSNGKMGGTQIEVIQYETSALKRQTSRRSNTTKLKSRGAGEPPGPRIFEHQEGEWPIAPSFVLGATQQRYEVFKTPKNQMSLDNPIIRF